MSWGCPSLKISKSPSLQVTQSPSPNPIYKKTRPNKMGFRQKQGFFELPVSFCYFWRHIGYSELLGLKLFELWIDHEK